MLVLARNPGQSVVLDDRIVVTVVVARAGLVRLGIEAPDGVAVRRGELALLPEARRPLRRGPRRSSPAAPSDDGSAA